MSMTIINTARPSRFITLTAASGIGLAPFAIETTVSMARAGEFKATGPAAAQVIDLALRRRTGRYGSAAGPDKGAFRSRADDFFICAT